MENYVAPVDEEILAKTMEMYYNDIPSAQQPPIFNAVIFKKFPNDKSGNAFAQYANYMVKNTFLLDEAKFNQFVNAPNLEVLNNDPVVQYMTKPEMQKAIDKTRKDMQKAAKEMDFLMAARLRDEMFALEKVFAERFAK